jgi:pre-mRNA-processing factor 6
LHVYLSL